MASSTMPRFAMLVAQTALQFWDMKVRPSVNGQQRTEVGVPPSVEDLLPDILQAVDACYAAFTNRGSFVTAVYCSHS